MLIYVLYGHLEYFTNIWDILRTFGIFYEHLGYFTNIWDILSPFGTFCVNLVHFSGLGIIENQEISGNPDARMFRGSLPRKVPTYLRSTQSVSTCFTAN
jgi:hypothetical protein